MSGRNAFVPLPLVGRQAELATMRRGLDAVAGGSCVPWVIAGGNGVGKTRLLQAAADEAQSRGFTTVRAVAYQSDANVPYSVVSDALTPLVLGMDRAALTTLTRGAEAELGQVVPAIAGDPDQVRRLGDARDLTPRLRWHTTQFLTRLSARTPLLFTVDNAHWADPSSVALLHFIVRHAADARLMIVVAWNHLEAEAAAPIRSAAKAMAGAGGPEPVMLSPLTVDDLFELLRSRFDADGPGVRDFASLLYGRTLGNPFFVEETLRTLVERGKLRKADGRWIGWDLDDIDLPATIREVLLERVGALSVKARHLAEVASVFGTGVTHELLGEASGLADAEFVPAADELRARAITLEREEGQDIIYEFTHPLLLRTLYEEVSAARRRELHGSIAALLEEKLGERADRQATELAYHFARSGSPALAPKSFRYLRLAGQDALAKHADREATRYLQHALDLVDRGTLADSGAWAMPGLVEDLARARQRLAEYEAARTLWLRARDFCDAAGDDVGVARIERRLGILGYWSGQAIQALRHYEAALERARRAGRKDIEVRTLVAKGVALHAVGQFEDAKEAVHEGLRLAEETRDAGLRARAEHALLILYAYSGPADVANGFAQRVLEHATKSGELVLAWSAHHATAVLACFTANAAAVAHHVGEARRVAHTLNSPLLAAQIAEVSIEYASAKGDWVEGLTLAERALPVARAMSRRSLLPRLLVWTGTIHLNRDELERAKACFDEAWELSGAGARDVPGTDMNAVIVAYIGQAAYNLTTRDWVAAIELTQQGIAVADRHGMRSWTLHRLLPMLAESALWVGDFALATSASARLREDSALFAHPLGEAWAYTVDRLVARWRDQAGGVVANLLQAAETLEAVPFVFHASRLRRHVARLLADDGDREGAARELRRAHDTFVRLGAALELRLTREQMRNLGLRPPQQSLQLGGVLSQREREIAELVASHKTNKEIARALGISARTVSTHVSNVFQKLGVDSRGALGDVIKRDLAGASH